MNSGHLGIKKNLVGSVASATTAFSTLWNYQHSLCSRYMGEVDYRALTLIEP